MRNYLRGTFSPIRVRLRYYCTQTPHKLHILQKDFDYTFVSKPYNLAIKGDKKQKEDQLLPQAQKYAQRYHYRPSFLIPLEKQTSGVTAFGHNSSAEEHLKFLVELPFLNNINRTFFAIVKGTPEKATGYVEGELVKPAKATRWILSRRGGAKTKTKYTVLDSGEVELPGTTGKTLVSLLMLRMYTQRRFQLRTLCGHLGCPIIGDKTYGGPKYPRILLHSSFVAFQSKHQKVYRVGEVPDWDFEEKYQVWSKDVYKTIIDNLMQAEDRISRVAEL